MKILIASANLGNFDTSVDPVAQDLPKGVEVTYFRWTDDTFPPITGLTPRLQYRIPKLFAWDMMSGYDYYLWLDGGMSLQRRDSIKWFLDKIEANDLLLFKHPWRSTIKEEVDHIEEKLQENNPYIVSRYKNGLHKQQYEMILRRAYTDDRLYASTAFMYKNTPLVRIMLQDWWYYQSRYWTCDQVVLPYLVKRSGVTVSEIKDNLFKSEYISLVSKHS